MYAKTLNLGIRSTAGPVCCLLLLGLALQYYLDTFSDRMYMNYSRLQELLLLLHKAGTIVISCIRSFQPHVVIVTTYEHSPPFHPSVIA